MKRRWRKCNYFLQHVMFYSGTKLLSLNDINNKKPEIYLCVGNRSSGKTVFFSKMLVNRFIRKQQKFMLLYRFNYELDNVEQKFFADIRNLFFPSYEMKSKSYASGKYKELFLNGASCGYAVSLNSADALKKYSHVFHDVTSMFMDEFQSETNNYAPHEIDKFISLHQSVARGGGSQSRYVPVYMCSNAVSLLNPYFTELNISSRLTPQVKFLRGNGYVLEQSHNESASIAQTNSTFNSAFEGHRYIAYAAQSIYLNDNAAFVEKLKGTSDYVCTIRYDDTNYGVKKYRGSNIVYCDDKPDISCARRYSASVSDHLPNYVLMKSDLVMFELRHYFDNGAFRFKNLKCKEAILKTLSY